MQLFYKNQFLTAEAEVFSFSDSNLGWVYSYLVLILGYAKSNSISSDVTRAYYNDYRISFECPPIPATFLNIQVMSLFVNEQCFKIYVWSRYLLSHKENTQNVRS